MGGCTSSVSVKKLEECLLDEHKPLLDKHKPLLDEHKPLRSSEAWDNEAPENWPAWAEWKDGEHGRDHAGPWLDCLVGFLLVLGPALYGFAIMCGDLKRVVIQTYNMDFTALSLSRFANSFSEIVCLSLVFFLWFTFCYFHETDVQPETTPETRSTLQRGSSMPLLSADELKDRLTGDVVDEAQGLKSDHRHRVRDFWTYQHVGDSSAAEWMKSKAKRGVKNERNSDKQARVTNIIHQIWRQKILGQGLMPGGFAPRITAISMGFLLFVGGTIVKTDIVKDLSSMNIAKGYDGCRAIAKDVPGSRLGRFARTPPVNCLGVDSVGGAMGDMLHDMLGYVSSGKTFVVMDYSEKVEDNIGDSFWAVRVRPEGNITIECNPVSSCEVQNFASEAEMNVKNPWLRRDQHTLDLKSVCSYQCTQWKKLSLKSMVTLSGSIFTGALFLTKFVEWFTALIGYRLVTESTSVAEITRLLTLVRYWRSNTFGRGGGTLWLRLHMRRTLCAVQLLFMLMMAYRLAPSVAIDGMFTADYYTALIAIFSTGVAAMQRYWNPFWCHPVIYTRKLWTTGEDEFYDPSSGKMKLDLFEWLHLHPTRRAELLFYYARKISDDEVKDAESNKRHPCVTCTKEVRDICSEEHCSEEGGVIVQAVREKIIPAHSYGRCIGGQGGKYKVMWYCPDGHTDRLKGVEDKKSCVFFTLQGKAGATTVKIIDTDCRQTLEKHHEEHLQMMMQKNKSAPSALDSSR